MDIETVRLILSQLSSMAAEAREGAIWYFALMFGKSIFTDIIIATVILVTVFKVTSLLYRLNRKENVVESGKQIAQMLKFYSDDLHREGLITDNEKSTLWRLGYNIQEGNPLKDRK